jgi:L-threonine kinase
MQSNPLLYQAFPVELCEAYKGAVRAREWSGKHSGLLEYAETALWHLGSLCLSDYRTRSAAPVDRVESQISHLRNKNLTAGNILELTRRSVEALSDPLIPAPRSFSAVSLPRVSRFAAAVVAIEDAIRGLSAGASPAALEVSYYVARGVEEAGDGPGWWDGWQRLIEYRNKVVHAAPKRWPTVSERYYEVMAPLLHEAIVELLTQAEIAAAILDHPVANLTNVDPSEQGFVHSICGEDRGVWFDDTIVTRRRIDERWKDEDWAASTAKSYILDRTSEGWAFRSIFWDLHNGLPPAMDMRLEEPTRSEGNKPAAKAPKPTPREGRGTAPGTCGEFAQGILPDGTPFHVTCPINKSATVIAQIRPASTWSVAGLRPKHRKLELALEYVAEELDLGAVEVVIRHSSDLDVGKGMGSSTADVLSGIRAVAAAAGEALDVETEGRLAARVESSDGTMFPGIAAVNHKTCELVEAWDWYPEFVIVMLVPHDSVDTPSISFDGQDRLAEEYGALLAAMDKAVARRSITEFSVQSTLSAGLNERFLANPYGCRLIEHLDRFDALGVNVGHTGTVSGLLFANTEEGRQSASSACFAVRKEFPELKDVKVVTTPHCAANSEKCAEADQPGRS